MSRFAGRRIWLLVLVSWWMVLAPPIAELYSVYSQELPKVETEDDADLLTEPSEGITAVQSIKQIYLSMGGSEQPTTADLLEKAQGDVAGLFIEIYDGAGKDQIKSFYDFYTELKAKNEEWSEILNSVILLTTGEEGEVNIAVDSIKKLAELSKKLKPASQKLGALPKPKLLNISNFKSKFSAPLRVLKDTKETLDSVNTALEKPLAAIAFITSVIAFAGDTSVQAGVFNVDSLTLGVDMAINLALMICAFLPPPANIVAAAITVVYFVAKAVVGIITAETAKFDEAYKKSYEFLELDDPGFPEFVEAMKVTSPQPPQLAQALKNSNGEMTEEVKRAYLAAYYHTHQGDLVNDLTLDQMIQIWKDKASFLSWQPETSQEGDSIFDTIGHGLRNFWGAITGLQKQTLDIQKYSTNQKLHPVMANPDFVLIVRLQNYIDHSGGWSSLNQAVLGRVQRLPFHFIYLLQIPQNEWSPDVFKQALRVDAMTVGSMEIKVLGELTKQAVEQAAAQVGADSQQVWMDLDSVSKIDYTLTHLLLPMAKEAQSNPNKVYSERQLEEKTYALTWDFSYEAAEGMNWANHDEWKPQEGKTLTEDRSDFPTPKNFLRNPGCKEVFEGFLLNGPFFVGDVMAQCQRIAVTYALAKEKINILKKFAEERHQRVTEFKGAITRPEIKSYAVDGKYLGLDQGDVAHFLGGVYPLLKTYEDGLKVLDDQVKKLEKKNEELKSSTQVDQVAQFANKAQKLFKETLETLKGLDILEIKLDPSGQYGKDLYLSEEFVLKQF